MPASSKLLNILLPSLLAVLLFAGCSAESKRARLLDRADRYFTAGEYDEARIVYLNVLRDDPENAVALGRIGIIWFEQGSPFKAFPFLKKARELDAGNVEARLKLALALLAAGQTAEAREETEAVLKHSPNHGKAILHLAESSFSAEEIEATQERIEAFDGPPSADLYLAAAQLAIRKGDIAAAEESIREAIAADPKSPSAHLAMARLHSSRKDTESAGKSFNTAAELAPLRSPIRLKYAEFKAHQGDAAEAKKILDHITAEAPDYLPGWKLLAQVALAEKDYESALRHLDQVFSRDASNYEARILQAQVLLAKGEAGRAVESLKRLEKNYSRVPALKYHIARAHLGNGDAEKALLAAQEAVTMNPDFVNAVILLGELNLRSGNAQPAMDAMVELLEKRPGLVQAELILSAAYRSLGRLEDSANVYRRQIEASPERSQPHFMLGVVLRQQNKIAEARESLAKAQELSPESILPTVQLVELDLADKDYETALERVRRFTGARGESPEALFLEGKIHATRGEWDLAEADLLESLELNPNSAEAYSLLISTYISADKLTEAVSRLDEVIAKSPGNLRALMMLALIHERTSEFAKARDAYERILAAKPDFVPAMNNMAYICAEKLDDLDKAYELAVKARSIQPDDAAIADTLGWILYRRQDYDQALILLRESARKLPGNAEIQFHLGMVSYMTGNSDEAREALRKVVDSPIDFPGKEDARRRLALLEENSGSSEPLTSADLEALLTEQPNDPVALMRLGEAYEREGNPAKAVDAGERALALNPALLPALLQVARLYAGPVGDAEKALEYARKARELAPNNAAAAATLGDVAFQSGNHAWAYSLLKESSGRLRGNVPALHTLAWSAYSVGRVEEARKTMQRITGAAPGSTQAADAATFLAMTAPGEDDTTPAESEADAVLVREPEYVPALMVKARERQRTGDDISARHLYERALNRFPEFTPAQKQLATLYAVLPGKLDDAYDLALKARKTLRTDAELARTLGEISHKKGEHSYAVQLLEESARKKSLDAEGLFYLGLSRLRLKGKSAEGSDALSEAVRAGLEEPLLSEAKKAIAEAKD